MRAGGHLLAIGERRPLLMGIVNATPDSFSDGHGDGGVERSVTSAQEQLEAGADIVDIGGESARTDTAPISAAEEIERVAPVIERVARLPQALVSVDTYKPAVAEAAIAAGARLVNDTSGLRDPELADVCAAGRAGLVVMHTAAAPKRPMQTEYADIVDEVRAFIETRAALAVARGVPREHLIADPGPDFAKTPAQTVELLCGARRLHELGLPLMFAISRKDFIGALTSTRPKRRLGGTLAALAWGIEVGAQIFRVHDVAAARDFIAVLETLRGQRRVASGLRLPEALRREAVR